MLEEQPEDPIEPATQPRQTRIYVCDDHQIVAQGVARVLAEKENTSVVRIFNSGADVLEQLKRTRPNILFCDIQLGDMSGLMVAEKVMRYYPTVKIILLSMHNTIDFVMDAKRLGVHGYVLKNSDPDELYEAIDMVMKGKYYYSPKLPKPSFPDNYKDPGSVFLTQREKEVLKLMVDGYKSLMIAGRLHISIHTVETHRKNLLAKAKCHTSLELYAIARERGWLAD